MNYFNTLMNQARDLFLSLTPQARLMAVLLTAMILVSGGFLVRGTTTTAKEKLFSGYIFTDQELKNAQIALSAAKLNDWEVSGNQLLVPKAKRDVYFKALGENGAFPKELGSWTDKAIEGGSIFDGNFKSQARMLAGKQKDLGQVIAQLRDIEYAWVSYDEQKEGFARELKKTASVFVMPSNNAPIPDTLKQSIAKMVQSSFAGLRYENVSVMDLYGKTVYVGAEDPMKSGESKHLVMKRQYESDLRKKALNLLSEYSVGASEVKVEVSAEVDSTLYEAREETKYDKPTVMQQQSSTKSIESSKGAPGGRPGTEPNAGPNRSQSLATQSESSNKTKESVEGSKHVAGSSKVWSETPGLTLKNASFSVSIPKSYYQALHKRNFLDLNPDSKDAKPDPLTDAKLKEYEGEVKTKIEAQLAVLLPPVNLLDKGSNKFERVHVSAYIDSDPVEPAKETLAETATEWLLNNWQTIALIGVALFAILMLRSAVVAQPKSRDEEFARGFGVQVDEAMVGGDLSALMREDESEEDEATEENENSPVRRFAMTGEKVREELSQIVRDNPSAAVNIIRNWIGDAA